MHRSLHRIVRSMWTDSGMRSATLLWNSHSVSSGMVPHAQDSLGFGPHFEPPCPTSLPHASAVVSKTSWVMISGGEYFRFLLCSGRWLRSRESSMLMPPVGLREGTLIPSAGLVDIADRRRR